MVSRECVQRPKLDPSCAKFFVSVSSESTNVCSDHLRSIKLEVKVANNWGSKELETCIVVASPVKTVLIRSQSWTSTYNEWPFVFAFQEEICIVCLEQTVVNPDVCVCDVSVMCWVQWNCSCFNISFNAGLVGKVMCIVEDFCLFIGSKRADTVAKAWKFIHVKPNSRKLYFLVKIIQHVNPILRGIRMQEINKVYSSRPNSTNQIISTWGFYIKISFKSFIKRSSISDLDTSIDDWDILIVLQNFFHSIQREPSFINREIFKMVHVIDITPNSVQWKIVLCIFC